MALAAFAVLMRFAASVAAGHAAEQVCGDDASGVEEGRPQRLDDRRDGHPRSIRHTGTGGGQDAVGTATITGSVFYAAGSDRLVAARAAFAALMRFAASVAASSIAAVIDPALATLRPAMSNAVPWSGLVRMIGRPSV